VLVRPLAGPDRPLGILALGEKETERRFVEPDLVLIDAVAAEASAALERMLLVRRAAEEESRLKRQEEMDRRKSEFLSQVAHDLGTPLTSILWSSQNLIDGVLGPLDPRGAEAARSIRDAASHLDRLVSNLVAIARLDDGVPGPRPEPVRVAEALAEAASAIAPIAARKGVRVELDLAAGIPPAHCDREGLMKVALNLLDNAIKYAPAGSAVAVRLAQPAPGTQVFAIEDTGPGVPEAQKRVIFERYARGDAPPRGARPGFGLGLFVARTAVEACGGTLDVRDVPGGGASFVCTLRDFGPRGGSGSWPSS
jgi:signal transduction histidine kinase